MDAMAEILTVSLKVGMEIHVELATRTKMFSRVASPASPEFEDAEPNTLIDPVVLGLPGALPVLNRAAIEKSMLVGLALGCQISRDTKWDRKSYFYPDLPKNYQISQYDLPLCYDGALDVHTPDGRTARIGIVRAHLEEDAGKLLHEWPGGQPINHSIVDLNRAGTPLLEIVTAPDFTSADQAEAFARQLRNLCRFLGVTEGIMQKGHMRFEPNINTIIELSDGRLVTTPIVEIKNLNSFKALRGAIEFELREQPGRWRETGLEMASGTKSTRGWDDVREATVLQREKEEAHDYRYFPDPDLLPVRIDEAWIERIRAELPELPRARSERYQREFGLGERDAAAIVEERGTCELFEAAVGEAHGAGGGGAIEREIAGRTAANLILQAGGRLANERGVHVHELGLSAVQLAGIIVLREQNKVSANGAELLFEALCDSDEEAPAAAARLNLVQVSDAGQLEAWVDGVLDDPANAQAVADLRAGKQQAIGRLVGGVMKLSAGKADAKAVREMILERVSG
jgi:aspartyl-tRNA(Asn)/glutamyl-tRNA(Gln) amidotransferase subunit B